MKRTVRTLCALFLTVLTLTAGASAAVQLALPVSAALEESCGESALGRLAADALKNAAQADAAAYPADALGITLSAGELTQQSLCDSFPTVPALGRAQITAGCLLDFLSGCADVLRLTERESVDWSTQTLEGYYVLSGLSVSYDLSAPEGQRVYTARLDDGRDLLTMDASALLTLAAPAETLEAMGAQPETLNADIRQAVDDYLAAGGTAEGQTARIRLLGAHANELIGVVPPALIALAALIMLVFSGVRYKERYRNER